MVTVREESEASWLLLVVAFIFPRKKRNRRILMANYLEQDGYI